MRKFVEQMEFKDFTKDYEMSKEGFLRNKHTLRFSMPFSRKNKNYTGYSYRENDKDNQMQLGKMLFMVWGIEKEFTRNDIFKMRQMIPDMQPLPVEKIKAVPKEKPHKKVIKREPPKPKEKKVAYDEVYDFKKMQGTSPEYRHLDCPQCDPMTPRWDWNYN